MQTGGTCAMKTYSSRDEAVMQDLARRMIATLGREAAIDVCRSNLWFGIATKIEAVTDA